GNNVAALFGWICPTAVFLCFGTRFSSVLPSYFQALVCTFRLSLNSVVSFSFVADQRERLLSSFLKNAKEDRVTQIHVSGPGFEKPRELPSPCLTFLFLRLRGPCVALFSYPPGARLASPWFPFYFTMAIAPLSLASLRSWKERRAGRVLGSFLLLFLIPLLGECTGDRQESVSASDGVAPQQQTVINVYYEAQCPFSYKWFKEQLAPLVEAVSPAVLQSAGISIVPVPYGNTEEIPNDQGGYDYRCQHGATECYLNEVQACGLYTIGINNISSWLPWLLCVEETSAFPENSSSDSSSFSVRRKPQPLLLGGRLIKGLLSSTAKHQQDLSKDSSSSSSSSGFEDSSLPSEGVAYSLLELSSASSVGGKSEEENTKKERETSDGLDMSRVSAFQKLLRSRLQMKQEEKQGEGGDLVNMKNEDGSLKEKEKRKEDEEGQLSSSLLLQFQQNKRGSGEGSVYDWVTCPAGEGAQSVINSLLILACTETEQGDNLIHLAGQATGDHDYVPWVLINGKHSEAAEKDLGCALCDALDLSQVPEALKAWCTNKKEVTGGCPSSMHASDEEGEKEDRCYVNDGDKKYNWVIRDGRLFPSEPQQALNLRIARQKEA
ncbi:interferon gamma-inducible protein, partial [Cystoisospora suis]